jgi:hypothetical protein
MLVCSLVVGLEVSSVVVRIRKYSVCIVRQAKTSSHRSILMFPDPYSSCDVEIYPDPKLVAGTILENEVVWNVGWVVVVTVGRFVVVMGLSRVEGRYVKRVGIR